MVAFFITIGIFIGLISLLYLRILLIKIKNYELIIVLLGVILFIASLCFRFYEFHFNLTNYNYYKIADICFWGAIFFIILYCILRILKR